MEDQVQRRNCIISRDISGPPLVVYVHFLVTSLHARRFTTVEELEMCHLPFVLGQVSRDRKHLLRFSANILFLCSKSMALGCIVPFTRADTLFFAEWEDGLGHQPMWKPVDGVRWSWSNPLLTDLVRYLDIGKDDIFPIWQLLPIA